jgi:5-methylcytosine-specific restriction endonuclease McrA
MNIGNWIKNDYDTLTTRPNRDPQYYLLRHLRRRGLLHVDGGGRLARFGRISQLKRVCPRTVIAGRLDRIFVAEYEHYVWRVRPHCVYCGILLTRSTLTRDHVVPRAHGGGGGENLVPSCGPCNRAKGCRTLLQFLFHRRPAWPGRMLN